MAVSSQVGAVASLPFGVLADKVRRTWTLAIAIAFWGVATIWSATVDSFGNLRPARLALGVVTAAAGPLIASLVGDYFLDGERGRIDSFILTGELIGAGAGFAGTGDIAALSWRVAFAVLAVPAFALAYLVFRLPEPKRGGEGALVPDPQYRKPRSSGSDRPLVPLSPDKVQQLVREQHIDPDPRLVQAGPLKRNRLRCCPCVMSCGAPAPMSL